MKTSKFSFVLVCMIATSLLTTAAKAKSLADFQLKLKEALLKRSVNKFTNDQELRELFDKIDKDHNSFISMLELFKSIKEAGIHLEKIDLKYIKQFFQKNNDKIFISSLQNFLNGIF